jgi:hypothetical protein
LFSNPYIIVIVDISVAVSVAEEEGKKMDINICPI